MLSPKRTSLKLIAAVLGILATGAPMMLFNAWLKKQGDAEVSITAHGALAIWLARHAPWLIRTLATRLQRGVTERA